MARPIAIIDVDLTVVDSVLTPHGWLAWLNAKTGQNFTAEELEFSYNLAKKFQPFWPEYDTETPMSWWRYPGIYDHMKPIEGSVEAIERIAKQRDIVFTSHCKGAHTKSKFHFLKRHFGHVMSGFVATKEKNYVSSSTPALDLFVDDRHESLSKFLGRRGTIVKFDTKWTQFQELPQNVNIVTNSWTEIADRFENIY